MLVLVLVAVLASPAIEAALEGPPPPEALALRSSPVAALGGLDPIPGLSERDRPKSDEPVAGMAFVRCTRLWTSDADGSNARRVLEVPGIGSPAFSPDGRSIAFVRSVEGSQEIWVTAADGSSTKKVGALTSDGLTPDAYSTGLAWSPRGKELALALVDRNDLWSGGSVLFLLDLSEGTFERLGAGWPAPFWLDGRRVVFAQWDDTWEGGTFSGKGYTKARMSTPGRDVAAGAVDGTFTGIFKHGVATIHHDGRGSFVTIRSLWRRKALITAVAPDGYSIVKTAQPAMAQDASVVAIDLWDEGRGRDIGLLDTVTGEWQVLDYAWDPAASPIPMSIGPVGVERARTAAEDLLTAHYGNGQDEKLDRLMGPRSQHDVIPGHFGGFLLGEIAREGSSWIVPALVYGREGGAWQYRDIEIVVRLIGSRLVTEPRATSAPLGLNTIAEGVAFAERVVGHEVPAPAGLSADARLDLRYPGDASAWRGSEVVTLNLVSGSKKSKGGDGVSRWGFGYGDVGFGLGCGGIFDPKASEVGDQPAVTDSTGTVSQVIWPATLEDQNEATVSVHGEVSREAVRAVAEVMEASR